MADDQKVLQLLERLLETTQDLFIFQALQSGMKVHTVKSLLRVSTDRVTRALPAKIDETLPPPEISVEGEEVSGS